MWKSHFSFWAAVIFLVSLGTTASAQKSSDLRKKRETLQKKIEYTNQLLTTTRNNQRLSQTELVLLNKQISFREAKIANISREIRKLDVQIEETNSIIESMENDLAQLKVEYAKMIQYAYKNRNKYDRLVFIFASTDINQAFKRMKYMQQYSEARQQQARDIQSYAQLMSNKLGELEQKKAERQALLGIQNNDKKALQSDRSQQQEALTKLRNDESKLRAQLRAQERDKEKLNQAIAFAIKKEIERERAKNKGVFKLTPEAKLVSSQFEKNRGNLPWPVERGIITSTFGEHPHPTIPGLKIKNNGIDISTNKDATVRAVFAGEVISVIVISGAGKTVMVQHGGYYTTYSNLKEVFVKKGDKVATKTKIGNLLTDKKTVAHFEIWKVSGAGGMAKENPALWIYQR